MRGNKIIPAVFATSLPSLKSCATHTEEQHAETIIMDATQITQAYDHCLQLARSHYENFPVASHLIPKAKRAAIATVYAFARSADDFADEGVRSAEQRLTLLHNYRERLNAIQHGQMPDHPIFIAIKAISQQYQLPLPLFDDLLTAFIMDVTKKRYANQDEVLNYCRHSANPVGRLLLHIYGAASEQNLTDSDAICSALQLINFLQDIEQDYVENNRIYIPQDALDRHGIDESWFKQRRTDAAMRDLIGKQITDTRALLLQGAPLAWHLQGRFGLEIRMTVFGGLRILDKLAQQHHDVFSRPRLGFTDKLWMLRNTVIGAAITH